MDTKPGKAVTIIDCNMNVEFDAPVGCEELEKPRKEKPLAENREWMTVGKVSFLLKLSTIFYNSFKFKILYKRLSHSKKFRSSTNNVKARSLSKLNSFFFQRIYKCHACGFQSSFTVQVSAFL